MSVNSEAMSPQVLKLILALHVVWPGVPTVFLHCNFNNTKRINMLPDASEVFTILPL